jgi:hypothetical protein
MADDEIRMKKERDPIMTVCFVVFLLTVAAITSASVYNNYIKADNTVAMNGNTVEVNYTGTYYGFHGEDNAVVFDTSILSIANDDEFVKSNGFTKRNESDYKVLSFTVGGTSVLAGFGNSVIGHKVGDKIQVKLPAGEGYNAPDTEKTVKATDVTIISSTEILTAAQFKSIYGYDLKGHAEMEKCVYGWPASASFNSANNTITMTYRPVAGGDYTVTDKEDNGFGTVKLHVTGAGSSISYTYIVSDYKVVSEKGKTKEIQMILLDLGTSKVYIKSVESGNDDGPAEYFTYKTVTERYNQDLYFEIEIVSIK